MGVDATKTIGLPMPHHTVATISCSLGEESNIVTRLIVGIAIDIPGVAVASRSGNNRLGGSVNSEVDYLGAVAAVGGGEAVSNHIAIVISDTVPSQVTADGGVDRHNHRIVDGQMQRGRVIATGSVGRDEVVCQL